MEKYFNRNVEIYKTSAEWDEYEKRRDKTMQEKWARERRKREEEEREANAVFDYWDYVREQSGRD